MDILINNAGVFRPGDLEDFDFTQMEGMRRINVDGLVAVTRAVVAGMKERKFGRIVKWRRWPPWARPWPAPPSTPPPRRR